jgi:hypothetical protein
MCGHHFFSVFADVASNVFAGPVYGQFLICPPALLHWPYQMQWLFEGGGDVGGSDVMLSVGSEVVTL